MRRYELAGWRGHSDKIIEVIERAYNNSEGSVSEMEKAWLTTGNHGRIKTDVRMRRVEGEFFGLVRDFYFDGDNGLKKKEVMVVLPKEKLRELPVQLYSKKTGKEDEGLVLGVAEEVLRCVCDYSEMLRAADEEKVGASEHW